MKSHNLRLKTKTISVARYHYFFLCLCENCPFNEQTILVLQVNIIVAVLWCPVAFKPNMRSDCTAQLIT